MSADTTEEGEWRARQRETLQIVTRNVAVLANDFGHKYLSEQMHFE